MPVNIGLIGYGAGGRLFHAPYILASRECSLVGIVTRSPSRAQEARADIPGVRVFDTANDLLDSGVDAVVVSTPPATRSEVVLQAIGRGANVVADKPFAPNAGEGRRLVAAAEDAGVLLNVFHNRRWDSDIVTARSVMSNGRLGRIRRLDLRFDLDDAATFETGPAGGLLRDLGSHVVDQALVLLGAADRVSAQLDWIDTADGRTDGGFTITIEHETGAHSHVSASKLNRLDSRELRLHGENGSYTSNFRDVQFADIRAGRRPELDRQNWGFEREDRWGTLATLDGLTTLVPSEQGDYTAFYDQFARAIRDRTKGPVPGEEGVAVLEVLDAVRVSAEAHQIIDLRKRQ